jgi:hypothetical protein
VYVLSVLNESSRTLSRRAVLWFCCRIPTHPVVRQLLGKGQR